VNSEVTRWAISPCNDIKAVLFDADGVLQQPSTGWLINLERLCPIPGRAPEFLNEVFTAERPCLAGTADFASALDEVLRRWGSGCHVEDALAIWRQIEPAQGLLDVVRQLRKSGFLVALATNQHAYRAEFMSEQLGYASEFDHEFYSCRIGHAKPSGEFFLHALDRLGLRGHEVLLIDDKEPNIRGAREAGLHAVLFHLSAGSPELESLLRKHGLYV
jgi:putative hydrolase of the HAD superfamily